MWERSNLRKIACGFILYLNKSPQVLLLYPTTFSNSFPCSFSHFPFLLFILSKGFFYFNKRFSQRRSERYRRGETILAEKSRVRGHIQQPLELAICSRRNEKREAGRDTGGKEGGEAEKLEANSVGTIFLVPYPRFSRCWCFLHTYIPVSLSV